MRIAGKIMANIAMANYLPIAKVQISNGGIAYIAERNKQATAEDKEDLRRSFVYKGYDAIDEMLRYLELNPTIFTAWVGSTAFTHYNSLLVRNADEFRLIDGKRTVFLKLIPYIEDVEVETIERILPLGLITELKSGEVTGKKLELLKKYVRPIVANKALYKALSAMAIVLNENTISIFDNSSANQSKGYKEASDAKIEDFEEDLERTANNRILLMNEFIKLNATDLGITLAPITTGKKPFKNTEENKTKFF